MKTTKKVFTLLLVWVSLNHIGCHSNGIAQEVDISVDAHTDTLGDEGNDSAIDDGVSSGSFHESFDTLDLERWSIAEWGIGLTRFGPDQVAVADGLLDLIHLSDDGQWLGGEVYTQQSFLYGTWTARLAAPAEAGTVCAFFFYNEWEDDRGTLRANEMDFEIMDERLIVTTLAGYRAIDGETPGPTVQYSWWDTPDDFRFSDFHEYTLEWAVDTVRFSVDDILVAEFAQAVPQGPIHVHVDHWTEAEWADVRFPPPEEPIHCRVDWIRGEGFEEP